MAALPSFSPAAPLFLIAGPCAIESRQMALDVAGQMAEICTGLNLPYIFKSSYDKANRTAIGSGRGVGLDDGLDILAEVKKTYGVPVLTDVHLPEQAATVAEVADILQIPAFLCRQTDLITACAATGRTMNIKKGQFLAPDDMQQVVKKAQSGGVAQVLVCERGSSFGYHDLVVDMRSLVWLRQTGCPVVFDVTHSVQLPGGGGDKTAGVREMAAPLARAAVAVGVSGLFIETHPQPQKAVSDSATQIPLADMPALLASLLAIQGAVSTLPPGKE